MLTARKAIWYMHKSNPLYARLTHLQTIASCRVSNVPGAILLGTLSMVAHMSTADIEMIAAELLSRMCGRNWHSTIPVAVSAPSNTNYKWHDFSAFQSTHMHRGEQCRWSTYSIIRRRREKCYRNMTISMQIFRSPSSSHFLWPLLVSFFCSLLATSSRTFSLL